MQKRSSCLLLLAAVLACSSVVFGKIHHSVVDKDDRKLIPLTDAFGFGEDGYVDIMLQDIAIWTKHDVDKSSLDFDQFGFFWSSVEADVALEQDLIDDPECILRKVPSWAKLFTFHDTNVQPLILENKAGNMTYHARGPADGLFYLYFANCMKNVPVSFSATIDMYNVDPWGRQNYLSIGETELEAVYWIMFSLFTVITFGWAYYVYRNRVHAHKIHVLMFALGLAKSLTLMSQAGMFHYIERTGHADGWNIAYYVFTLLRGVLFFTVVVLIGTGWSYMKPFLGDKEKRILLVVVPLQVFANIAIIITEEESPSATDWFTWRDVFHLVDIICCCAILFPIVWSIKHLREASQTDGKAARNLEKLTLFRQFYVMVVVYIYFTRIVVYLLKSTMDYQYTWVSDSAEQLATLAFYVWTAVKFRPHNENPYLKLEQSEIEL